MTHEYFVDRASRERYLYRCHVEKLASSAAAKFMTLRCHPKGVERDMGLYQRFGQFGFLYARLYNIACRS